MTALGSIKQVLRKGGQALELSEYGARRRDRLRILLLTAAMPLIRRAGHGRRVSLQVKLGDIVIPWTADNYADLGVLEEVFGREIYALRDIPEPATILDVGAHVGASVLYFAHRYPAATIIAVEADPLNFAKLARNVGHLPQVRLVHAAAASETGTLTLYSSGGVDSWKSSTQRTSAWQQPVNVAAVRLDDLLATHSASDPVLIKIDIEGAEYDVLRSFSGLGSACAIVGEVHPELIGVPIDEFRGLLHGFDLDLPPVVRYDTAFRASRAASV